MIGIPGQTYKDLARDILTFRKLDLDMIGVGPFIPHPETPLGQTLSRESADEQVPNTEKMTYKVIALTSVWFARRPIFPAQRRSPALIKPMAANSA